MFVLLQGMGANDRFTYAFSTFPQVNVSGTDVATHAHISGVLVGYALLFPGRHVRMMVARGKALMPAWVAIVVWFLLQVVAGMGLLSGRSQPGGVAYAAHVGGFIAGLVLVKMFAVGRASR